MPSFDPDPYGSRRHALRLLILALFLGWILVGHFAHAAVMVTADSPPNWNPAGSVGGTAELSELLKQPVGTGRGGYPPVPIAKKESVPAPVAKGALRGVMRAGGWVMWGLVIVELGGEFYNWLQCSTNQICKPPSQSGPTGPGYYVVGGQNASNSVTEDGAASLYMQQFPHCGAYNIVSRDAFSNGVFTRWLRSNNCGWIAQIFYIACPSGQQYYNNSCSPAPSTQPVPVTDSELDNAAQALISQRPASAIDALRRAGSWDQLATKRVYPEQTNVQGNPVSTQTPDGRTKTVTPGTKAREQPAPAGSTNNSTVVYNYNTTTITNADGSTETTVTEEDAGISDLEVPDDYAREDTLQEVRDALVNKPDPAPKPETATQPKQAVQTYFDILKTVPIVDTIGGGLDRWETDFSGGGSCPTYDIPVYGTIRTMTSHCIVGEAVRDFLAAVLAVIYSIAAVRIFLSA
ncbi:hypothetical protein [Plasticicumulans sp.]|uniref:hypothetical protein n=1 Tax=Plasticicumulans sp. TaxID=2307179 RepID=UPI003932DAFC